MLSYLYGNKTKSKPINLFEANDLNSKDRNPLEDQPKFQWPSAKPLKPDSDLRIEKKDLSLSEISLVQSLEIIGERSPLPSPVNVSEVILQNIPKKKSIAHNPYYASELRGEENFGKRRVLKTREGRSFVGALLQCLYHLSRFRALLYDYENENQGHIKPVASMLAHFFKSMDKSDANSLNKSADELIKYVSENFQNQYDSRSFWKALYNGLSSNESIINVPFLNLFAGLFQKITYCKICKQPQETFLHKLTPLDLEVREYMRNEIDSNSLSIPLQLVSCRCPSPSQQYQQSYLLIDELPELVALDISLGGSSEVKILPKIRLKALGDEIGQIYDYCGGVFTKDKDEDDGESIAIIQCGGNKNSYYKFADDSVQLIKLDDSTTDYYPKLLFYCKSQ